jgi:hypothetical protein
VKPELKSMEHTEMVGSTHGRSTRPAGLSQLGYACFWPNGGGLREGMIHPSHPDRDSHEHEHDEHSSHSAQAEEALQ